MSKRKIIILSVIGVFVALNIVLFGFVFRLRNQSIVVVGEEISYDSQDIIKTAGLENGKSIFLLDKDKAIENIENRYADLKVIQIRTTNITSIEFKVRARYKTYYVKTGSTFYVLDEDLKVLEIIENENLVQSLNLVEIESSIENLLQTTGKCTFVGSEIEKNIFYNLYVSIHTDTTISENLPTATESHSNMANIIKSVSIKTIGAKDGSKDNVLSIVTEAGMKFKIHNADIDLNKKFSACYELMNDSSKVADNTKGTIDLLNITDTDVTYVLENE